MNSNKTPVATEPAVEPAIQAASAAEEALAPKAAPKKKSARKVAGDVTLADLADRYIKHLEDAGKSPGTCSSYSAELKLAMKELGPETPIASITTDQVEKYFTCKRVTKLRSGKAKAKPSVDKTRRVLRLALVFAAEKKWLASAPIPAPAAKA